MYKLVLIRHGESTWNLENRFTGWTDVELTPTGISQAMAAGKLLKAEGYEFDVAYTSVLKRAIHTLNFCLDAMDRIWLPVVKDWRLNERHYGGLQGLDKAETAARHGEEQVKVWRRSYDIPPPPMDLEDPGHPMTAALVKEFNSGAIARNAAATGREIAGRCARALSNTSWVSAKRTGCPR